MKGPGCLRCHSETICAPFRCKQEKQRSDFHHSLLRKNCVVESDGDEYLIEFLM